jgi:hypothetical protein
MDGNHGMQVNVSTTVQRMEADSRMLCALQFMLSDSAS